MRQELQDRLNKLNGKKEVLDPKASNFIIKNEEWIRGEKDDDEIKFLERILRVDE